MTLHYTSGSGGLGAPIAAAGFNLVDVQSVDQLKALPAGQKGLVWLNEVNGATSSFTQKVAPFIGNPNLYGFFLADEPDPTGKWGTYASAANLKAESDWIHANVPGAKTFITMMNMGSSTNPDFSNTYNPANTHIDYYGVDPYPVRTGTSTIDYNMIDRAANAAVASGIPASQIVPVYQAFGGGSWTTDTGGQYVMPTAAQEQTMMDHWAKLAPSPAFDYAYAWGSQQGDTSLGSDKALQSVFLQHNTSSTTPPASSSAGTSSTPAGTGTSTSSGTGTSSAPSGTGTSSASSSTGTSSAPAGATTSHTIYGTPGDNVLHGTTGADTMVGGAGNDTYYVNNAGDRVLEAIHGGTDTVLASVSHALLFGSEIEHLATTNRSGTTAINLSGNSSAQTIDGNAGPNVINGRGGHDVLTGNGGKDVFVFHSALKADNIAKVTDFNVGQDKIQLDHSVFAGLHAGALPMQDLHIGASAHAGTDHIIYNSSTGALSFDSDGSGAAHQVQFAALAPHLSLTASSFVVV
jgi:Ca2+-binding RTX toxin-like protein